jgi:two-component system sensor histidine kinase UhpB
MFVIILIVAVMADRVTSASRDIAGLEKRTHEQLLTARDDERHRLSADLHDSVGQTLTALVLTLDAAEAALASPDHVEAVPPASREALHRAQEIAGLALEETRDVARRIRPAAMREIGLANAIRELAAHAGRPIEVAFDPRLAAPSLLPVQDELQAYRIVQEAVANAVRHASARTIVIGLRAVRGSRLQIEVVDDGKGFVPDEADGDGLGLQGMRERAAAIGGTFSLVSRPGLGTRIRLLLPLEPQRRGGDA